MTTKVPSKFKQLWSYFIPAVPASLSTAAVPSGHSWETNGALYQLFYGGHCCAPGRRVAVHELGPNPQVTGLGWAQKNLRDEPRRAPSQ